MSSSRPSLISFDLGVFEIAQVHACICKDAQTGTGQRRDRAGSRYLAGPVCRAAPGVALSSLPMRHRQRPEESALRVRCSHQACQAHPAPPRIASGVVGTGTARLHGESWTKKIRGQKSRNSPLVSGGGVGARGHLTQRADWHSPET